MTATGKQVIATRYFSEIMTDGNLGTLYELLAPDFIFTLPTHPEPYVGPDGFRELVTMLHSSFPDFYIHALDMVASDETWSSPDGMAAALTSAPPLHSGRRHSGLADATSR